ncbi:MAG: type IX secretion system membrane protein PorP/SprF [Lewinellaceae bacterium]|nr:type IX secretion system membrane protein PorP/SprF [Lewinellaceae bacterium]
MWRTFVGHAAGQVPAGFRNPASTLFISRNSGRYYAGLSIPQTAGIRAKFKAWMAMSCPLKRPRIFTSNGVIFPSGQQGFIEPSFWLKYTPNAPMHVNLNIRQKICQQLDWRRILHLERDPPESGLILKDLLGLEQSLFRFGYSFDYNISSFGGVFGTSHELTVSYAWH